MATARFRVGDQVRDTTGLKDLKGKLIQGRITRAFDGQISVKARDGHGYFYGGESALRPLSNLERLKAALRIE
jgi:hypothetical protein